MKNIINLFWKPILIIIILIITFSWIGIDQCAEKKAELKTEKANIAILRAFLIDSTQTADHKENIAILDSAKAAEAIKTEKYKADSKYWNVIANKRAKAAEYYKYLADSIANTDNGECREIINAFRQANDTLQARVKDLDNENEALDGEAQSYANRLYMCEKQNIENGCIISEKEKYINTLETNISTLQCYRDWGVGHPVLKWLFGWKCR